jgi:SAM-dependent methyltransferase
MVMQPADDWYKTFFHGLAVEMWLGATTAAGTADEAEFIRNQLGVAPGAKLLDVPCGGGRHARALAAMGFAVTGVDISSDFLAAARADMGLLPIEFHQRDMTDLPWPNAFDGVYCFGNSFGYLRDADNVRFLQAVANALKPGARFILDYPVTLECLTSHFMTQRAHDFGDMHYERDGRYDPAAGRIIVEHSFTRNGVTEKGVVSQRAYTYREVCGMLSDAGFANVQGYGGMEREPFTLGSKRLIMVGTKQEHVAD